MRRHRAGFTLIELLIVVVIIGILAAIAIPKFGATKEQSFVAVMKSDLRNLVGAQEGYLGDNGLYYGGAIPAPGFQFRPTTRVTVSMIGVVPGGWAATASYAGTARTCTVFYGAHPAVAPATNSGEVACTP